ncbi:hypothetical protein DL769_009490 [Monosporascus sp. CRB-8-3]|nr:hypothetical protein DL769_009490 [Monosporascus sp. CRB-8-3]
MDFRSIAKRGGETLAQPSPKRQKRTAPNQSRQDGEPKGQPASNISKRAGEDSETPAPKRHRIHYTSRETQGDDELQGQPRDQTRSKTPPSQRPPFLWSLQGEYRPPMGPQRDLFDLARKTFSEMITHLDAVGRAQLARAEPLTISGQRVQYYNLDADNPVFRDVGPKMNPQETRPLLLWCIQNGTPQRIIGDIILAYKADNPQPFDSIWRNIYPAIKPPLLVAIESGRADVVELLLVIGGDPNVKFSLDDFNMCFYSGTPHPTCASHTKGQPQPWCIDAMRRAFMSAKIHGRDRFGTYRAGPGLFTAEDSMLALLERGAQIGIFDQDGEITEDFDELLKLRYSSVLKAVVDRVLALPVTDLRRIQLARQLGEILCRAASCYADKHEYDVDNIISPGVRRKAEEVARNATEFWDAAAHWLRNLQDDEMRDFQMYFMFDLHVEDRQINFSKALFRTLPRLAERRVSFSEYPAWVPQDFQGILFQSATKNDATKTVKWLKKRRCPRGDVNDHPMGP